MNFIDCHLTRRISLVGALVAGIVLILASGCQTDAPDTASTTPTPLAAATSPPQPTSIPALETSPTVNTTATPEETTIILTFWTVESISPEAEGQPGDFVSNSLRAFEQVNPNVEVESLIKKATEKGES